MLQVGKLANPNDDEDYVLLDISLVHGITAESAADGMIFALGEVCQVQQQARFGLRPRLVSALLVDDFELYRSMVLKRRAFLTTT